MRLGSRAKETKKKGTPRTQPGVREAGESGEQRERGTGPKGGQGEIGSSRNSLRHSPIEGNRVKSNSYARTTRRNAKE